MDPRPASLRVESLSSWAWNTHASHQPAKLARPDFAVLPRRPGATTPPRCDHAAPDDYARAAREDAAMGGLPGQVGDRGRGDAVTRASGLSSQGPCRKARVARPVSQGPCRKARVHTPL